MLARPAVVAHRGASAIEAEHTLAAYRRALDDGADGLECDVRLTRDGVLVCVHDRTINRTSSGRGVVSTLELAELRELDFGRWHREAAGDLVDPLLSADWEAPDLDRSSVLTLERLLETVADIDRPIRLAIETKHPTRYAGLVERRLVELLRSFGLAGPGSPARVMSFSPLALGRVKRLAPHLEVVLLIERFYSWQMAAGVLGPGWVAGPGIDLLRANARTAAALRRRGRRLHVWTVNTAADVDLCMELGVEAVITDDPRMVLRHLGGPSPLPPRA